jgi:iron complex transport system ATP-binding protein
VAEGVAPVVRLRDVAVRRDGRAVLGPIDWAVHPGERWVVLGANGAGKTTLLALCAGAVPPSAGDVELFGEPLHGDDTDLDALLPLVGWSSAALADQLTGQTPVGDVVLTGLHATLRRGREDYSAADRARARGLLARVGCRDLVERSWRSLSEGERKRVQLARALMPDPELVLLDEPAAGLDLAAREALLRLLTRMAAEPAEPPLVVVSHHVEEIPAGFTHALLLRQGAAVAAGAIDDVLTATTLSATFGLPLAVTRSGGRWLAHATLTA